MARGRALGAGGDVCRGQRGGGWVRGSGGTQQTAGRAASGKPRSDAARDLRRPGRARPAPRDAGGGGMRWIAQVGHVAAKDLRRSWAWLLFYAALIAVVATTLATYYALGPYWPSPQ